MAIEHGIPSAVFFQLKRSNVSNARTEHFGGSHYRTFASSTALATKPARQATTRQPPRILSRRSARPSVVNAQPAFAPTPATGTRSAKIIHPAGIASTTASTCSAPGRLLSIVTEKGLGAAARLYPAAVHNAPKATTAASRVVTR